MLVVTNEKNSSTFMVIFAGDHSQRGRYFAEEVASTQPTFVQQ